jgi:hypothetical protein
LKRNSIGNLRADAAIDKFLKELEQPNSALRDGKFPDSTKPVEVGRRIWRAKVKSKYIEFETDFDPSEDLDYLYENAGKMLL